MHMYMYMYNIYIDRHIYNMICIYIICKHIYIKCICIMMHMYMYMYYIDR